MSERIDHRLRILLLAAFVAAPVLGSAGVIEINQAKALAGGVTPGDDPLFPVYLATSGSYILTSDLDLSVDGNPLNTHAILVNGADVTIDLNGFAIRGIAACAPPQPTTCTPEANGNGINAPFGSNLTVKNGTIRGMGKFGIFQPNGSGNYADLDLRHNAGGGLSGSGATVRNVRAQLNGGTGIFLMESVVTGCWANLNESRGIWALFSQVSRNVLSNNGDAGLNASQSLVSDNLISVNAGTDLDLSSSTWIGNSITFCNGPCFNAVSSLQLGNNSCENSLCIDPP
jgi:hypothetical protein